MKILTLNTWQEKGPWQKRWEIILNGIKTLRPDVVGFQEVFNESWALEVQGKAGYPYLYFSHLSSGLVILSRYPIVEKECLTMKNQSPSEDYFRYAAFALLEMGKERLAFFNTHLSWRLEEGPVRENQVQELIEFMDLKAAQKEAVVVGDFNAPPQSAEIRKMEEAGFQDSFKITSPEDAGFTWDNRNPYAAGASHKMPDRRIDYIWFRNARKILKGFQGCERIFEEPDQEGVYATDHFGLLADF